MWYDPLIPTMEGTGHARFPSTKQTSCAPSAKHSEVPGESHEGCCMPLRTDRLQGGFRSLARTFLHMDNKRVRGGLFAAYRTPPQVAPVYIPCTREPGLRHVADAVIVPCFRHGSPPQVPMGQSSTRYMLSARPVPSSVWKGFILPRYSVIYRYTWKTERTHVCIQRSRRLP